MLRFMLLFRKTWNQICMKIGCRIYPKSIQRIEFRRGRAIIRNRGQIDISCVQLSRLYSKRVSLDDVVHPHRDVRAPAQRCERKENQFKRIIHNGATHITNIFLFNRFVFNFFYSFGYMLLFSCLDYLLNDFYTFLANASFATAAAPADAAAALRKQKVKLRTRSR